jgi:hypothetical protein
MEMIGGENTKKTKKNDEDVIRWKHQILYYGDIARMRTASLIESSFFPSSSCCWWCCERAMLVEVGGV